MNNAKSLSTSISIRPVLLNSFGASNPSSRKAVLIVAISLVVIDFLHYSTAPGVSELHAIYRYFYFLPIAYASLRFGLWGGLIATIAASLVFIPHIAMRWQDHPVDTLNDLLVVVVLFGVAVITGFIADKMRAAQAEQAAIAEALADSYHKLESQGAELRRAERLISLGTLAGGLAHQIRNPVSIIRASSQLLDQEANEETQEIAGVIQTEADRIEQLVSRLLNYAGDQPIKRSATEIGNLFAAVQKRVRVTAEPQGIDVVVHCDREVSTWMLDGDQIEQVLFNLCLNAVQAMEVPQNNLQSRSRYNSGHGKIHLRARTLSGNIFGDERPYLQLTVSDDGPGIPTAIHSQLFNPFFTTKETGIGLGLSVVQRIIEDHGGTIDLESQQRSASDQSWANQSHANSQLGTTFIIQLPQPLPSHTTVQPFNN